MKLDYEDFLRQRGLPQWPRDDARRQRLIDLRPKTADDVAAWAVEIKNSGHGGQSGPGGPTVTSTRSTNTFSPYPEIAANGALALIAVACSLLDRQIGALEQAFTQDGGFTERLYRVRTAARKRDGK